MFVMTAKVDKKKLLLALAAAAVLIVMLIMVFGGGDSEATPTAAPSPGTNEGRVAFLKDFGWEIATSPTESGQVKIPEKTS